MINLSRKLEDFFEDRAVIARENEVSTLFDDSFPPMLYDRANKTSLHPVFIPESYDDDVRYTFNGIVAFIQKSRALSLPDTSLVDDL